MVDRPPLEPIEAPLRETLRRMGLSEIEILLRLSQSWEELAGPPWAGVSSPVKLGDGELVVRAEQASSIRILRYASGALIQRLDEELGEGVVTSVRVVSSTS